MASVWKGSISFGLVNIPVQLHPAVRAGEDRVSFRLLHAADQSPIQYERICQAEGEPVPWNEIVKGYEYEKGKFVVLTEEDFKAAAIESSKAFDILDFVRADEVDPRYFEKPYFLVPAQGGEKAYALLREAIRRTGMLGIGKITIRQSQHLAAIKVVGDALVLEMMRFPNELVDAGGFVFPNSEGIRAQELEMAQQLIGNLAEPFEPTKYTDDYRVNLMRIIRAKMKGKKVKFEEPEEPPNTPVLDLMSRLQASLAKGKRKSGRRRPNKSAQAAGQRPTRTRRRKTA